MKPGLIHYFPFELVELIANEFLEIELDDFSLFQTCSKLLKMLCSKNILIDVVNKQLKRGFVKLPSIFYASIPSHLVYLPSAFDVICELNVKSCCVTGGYITKKVYDLEYESDIDIWIQGKSDLRYPSYCYVDCEQEDETAFRAEYGLERNFNLWDYLEEKGVDYDIVVKTHSPCYAMSGFDLSICQQGFVYDEYGKKELHITPLALYTYYTKTIVVTMTPLRRKYQWCAIPLIKTLYDYYERHISGFCNPNECFHKCYYCSIVKDDSICRRWFERLEKYEERFPGYTFTYVKQ